MTPYKCPICKGHGIVPGGFYLSTTQYSYTNCSSETCRACNGTGIVWGESPHNFNENYYTPIRKEENY